MTSLSALCGSCTLTGYKTLPIFCPSRKTVCTQTRCWKGVRGHGQRRRGNTHATVASDTGNQKTSPSQRTSALTKKLFYALTDNPLCLPTIHMSQNSPTNHCLATRDSRHDFQIQSILLHRSTSQTRHTISTLHRSTPSDSVPAPTRRSHTPTDRCPWQRRSATCGKAASGGHHAVTEKI